MSGDRPPASSLWRCAASTFLLTLSNPTTILSFMAVFGALAGRAFRRPAVGDGDGVLIGSALWWLILAAGVGYCASASTHAGSAPSTSPPLRCWRLWLWQLGQLVP